MSCAFGTGAQLNQWRSETDRQTDLFTPRERGQEHAANSRLTPLSNPSKLSIITHPQGAAAALSLARLRSCRCPLQTPARDSCCGGTTRAHGPGLFVCRRRRKAAIIRSEVALVARVMAAVQPPHFHVFWVRDSKQTRVRAWAGAASRPAVFWAWDQVKSGTVGSILGIVTVLNLKASDRCAVNRCESLLLLLLHSIFKLLMQPTPIEGPILFFT